MGREIHAVGSSGIQRIRVGSWDAGMETGDAWVGEWPYAVGGHAGTEMGNSQVGKWPHVLAKLGDIVSAKAG